jgi:hypothetical protein
MIKVRATTLNESSEAVQICQRRSESALKLAA